MPQTAVQATESGSVRLVTIVAATDAPSDYPYQVDVPSGGHHVIDVDASEHFVAGFAKPWAKDATGVEVPTHFEIDGSHLTQVVNHHGGDFTYPITADPWFWIKLVDRVAWSGRTLQVYPTW